MKKLLILILLFSSICYSQYYIPNGTNIGSEGYSKPLVSIVYDSKADSLFALYTKMGYSISTYRKSCINALYLRLKNAFGVQYINQIFDRFWIKNINSRLTLVDLANLDTNAVEVNTVVFIADSGYVGNTSGYINTKFNPSTDGIVYTQNDASMGFYHWKEGTTQNAWDYGAAWTGGSPYRVCDVIAKTFPAKSYCALNSPTSIITDYLGTTIGLFGVTRGESAGVLNYQVGDTTYTLSTSSALVNLDFFLMSISLNGNPYYTVTSSSAYSFAWVGKSLTTAQFDSLVVIYNWYSSLINKEYNYVIADGNSITDPTFSNPNWTSGLADSMGSTWKIWNRAYQGRTTLDIIEIYNTNVLPYYNLGKKNIYIPFEITNDIGLDNVSTDSAYAHIKRLCLLARADGYLVYVPTCLPRGKLIIGDFETRRLQVNDSIRTYWYTFCDGYIDIAGNTTFGQTGQYVNTTYYSDSVHLTSVGQSILKDSVYRRILIYK